MTRRLFPRPALAHPCRRRCGALVLAAVTVLVSWGGAAAAVRIELTGPALARVYVDGVAAGILPLEQPLELEAGLHELRVELPGHQDFRDELRLNGDEQVVRIHARLLRKTRAKAISSNLLLAGLGQHYMGSPGRGYLYGTAEIVGLLAAIYGEVDRSNHRSDYLVARGNYETAFDADEVERWRGETERTYNDMKDMETLRDGGLAIAVGAILVSMLDAWLLFPEVAASPQPVVPRVDDVQAVVGSIADPDLHVGVTLRF